MRSWRQALRRAVLTHRSSAGPSAAASAGGCDDDIVGGRACSSALQQRRGAQPGAPAAVAGRARRVFVTQRLGRGAVQWRHARLPIDDS
jgi:hypothetical protein